MIDGNNIGRTAGDAYESDAVVHVQNDEELIPGEIVQVKITCKIIF